MAEEISIPFKTLPPNVYIRRDGWLQIGENGFAEFWCLDDDGKTPIRFKDYCKKEAGYA